MDRTQKEVGDPILSQVQSISGQSVVLYHLVCHFGTRLQANGGLVHWLNRKGHNLSKYVYGNFAHAHIQLNHHIFMKNTKCYPILRFLCKPPNWPFAESTHTLQVIFIIYPKKIVCIKCQH